MNFVKNVMVKCSTESLLKAEIKDILFDLFVLNNVSMELQFQGQDMIFYRHNLKSAIGYALVLEYNLTKRKRPLDLTEFTYDSNNEDLHKLTDRVILNLRKAINIYENETPLVELLAATMFSLTLAKTYV